MCRTRPGPGQSIRKQSAYAANMTGTVCKPEAAVRRRDMRGAGRYPPEPRHKPIAFYTAIKCGDPEQLAKVMSADPYYVTQDNGAGAPIHFATTFCRLDMLHHLLMMGAPVNQRDERGMTALHRAAALGQHDGYLQLYEYLLSRGADPSVASTNYDPYLSPGPKLPSDLTTDKAVRARLMEQERKYADLPKAPVPNAAVGDWWALYDYGLDTILGWPEDYKHNYPEERMRERQVQEAARRKAQRRARREAAYSGEVLPDLRSPVGFLFPGQGSQAVGMLKEAQHLPAVKEMLATAERVLGYDLLAVCLEGPKEKLDDTRVSQPALLVAGLAAAEKLRAERPADMERCSACAGLSLGEYAALCFAGAISFEDAIKVVKVRAESMAAAAAASGGRPHGMLSVVGLTDADLQAVVDEVVAEMGGSAGGSDATVCRVANMLFPQGRVVSGHKDALARVAELAQGRGALKVAHLAVSGAFHTRLMSPAREALEEVLATVIIREPRIPVYSNVTGRPFGSASDIAAMLGRQLVEPVQWEKTLKALIGSGKTQLFELGPGSQIKSMLRRIDNGVWDAFINVQP